MVGVQIIMGEQLEFTWPKPAALLGPQELYDVRDLRTLQGAKENRRLERKPAGIHVAALAEYLSMFANTKPEGGVIIIGMENDGTISGCMDLHHNRLNALERAGDTHCPDARYEVRQQNVTRSDGTPDFLLMIRVFYRQDKVVRTTQGKAFTRRGESKTGLNSEQIRELQLDKGEMDLELDPCVALDYPSDFDIELVRQFADEFRKSRGLETSHTDEANKRLDGRT
jgi:ATP-dependent DNA helicase RecG